jgi:hypothetical protein
MGTILTDERASQRTPNQASPPNEKTAPQSGAVIANLGAGRVSTLELGADS